MTRQLLDCGIVFGCTDDEWGRSILNRLAIRHCIPVFDMGINIDTDGGKILSIQGRVTTLLPGAACLICRKRISQRPCQSWKRKSPQWIGGSRKIEEERKDIWLILTSPAPSVISFHVWNRGGGGFRINFIASRAFKELTGKSTEVIFLFDQSRIRTNSTPPSLDCFCSDAAKWGIGDTRRFLDLNLRSE